MFSQSNVAQEVVIHKKTKKVDNLVELFEIEECSTIIKENEFKFVALQFPDDYLQFSNAIVQKLKEKNENIKFYVLGDTSYGSCCVDEVAAEHINADFIIHYGTACLEK
jgi:diphthamide biosynthesis protein 2